MRKPILGTTGDFLKYINNQDDVPEEVKIKLKKSIEKYFEWANRNMTPDVKEYIELLKKYREKVEYKKQLRCFEEARIFPRHALVEDIVKCEIDIDDIEAMLLFKYMDK